MIKPRIHRSRGFTLVELLVVIAIIAVLASTTAVMAPRIKKRGQQAKEITNMRQITSLMTSYANDNSNRLPAPATRAEDNETGKNLYWFTHLEQSVNDTPYDKLTKDSWWQSSSSLLINPLHPKKDLRASSVGYAMNGALATNIAASRGEDLDLEDSKYTQVNLPSIRQPEKTPMIMPFWSWSYVCNAKEAADKRFAAYTVGDKLPVLFVDGRIESYSPKEYAKKRMFEIPTPE